MVRYHDEAAQHASPSINAFQAVPGLRHLNLPEGLDVEQSVEFFLNHPGVMYAEPNYSIELAATPNDPDFGDLWGMQNTGQTGGLSGADIDAPLAWDITTGAPNLIVAVVDTGVDYLHPDLAANMWVNEGEIAGDGIDNDGNGFVDDVHGYNFVSGNGDPMDDHNHGTHVAGTIGAVANNSIGVAGVAWDVQIMAVKFLSASGNGSIASAVSAIQYAVDNGATISNHSWGFNGNFSQSLSDAIEYARLADHLVVAAAGNGGGDQIGDDNDARPFYPGNFQHENLIAVAATDHEDQLASFSNYGLTQVDLGAPGVGILSTTRNNSYATFNGTSMATPHVTGATALLRGLYPDWGYDKIRDRILDTVDPVESLDGRTVTGGRLNLAAAVAPDESGPAVVESSPSGDVIKTHSQMTVTFSERIDEGTFTLDDVVEFEGPQGSIDVFAIEAVPSSQGRSFLIAFDPQDALGDYELTIGPEILDPFGNAMDQNANGISGETTLDRFSASFTIVPDTIGPYIVATDPSGSSNVPVDRVRVTFDEEIAPASFTADRVDNFTGPGGPIAVTDIFPVSDNQFDIVFPMQDAEGEYQFVISGPITDLAGNLIDQDQDGIGGENSDDRYQVDFKIEKWLYADHVIDFSSQFTTTSWSAAQALGAPDTFSYGDFVTAWAPRPENGTTEFLTVGFEEPLLSNGVVIRETFGNGFVRLIEARDASTGEFHVVAQPTDDSPANIPFDFIVQWPQTDYPVDAVRITIDTDHDLNAFEEIDSVQLRGMTVPDTDGARIESSSLDGSVAGPVDRVELMFDEPVQDGTFTLDDIQQFVGPGGAIEPAAVNRLTSSHYEVVFPPQTAFGDYSMTLGPDILDLDGLPLNQDQDEINGESIDDQFEVRFNIELWQFAGNVIDFSSQFGTSSWSAEQATGPSNTLTYGDSRDAWAPARMNGTTESITLGFDEPVLASGVQIRETFGNGFVRTVEVRDSETGLFTTVSTGPDDSQPGTPVDFVVTWPLTSYTVDAVRIGIDTDHSPNYEEIDSVQLRGVPAPDVTGPMVVASTPSAGHPGPIEQIDLVFSEPIEEGTFTTDDLIGFDGPDGPIASVAINRISETDYRLTFPRQESFGSYALVIGPEILDEAGNAMDQDGDGTNGGPIDDRFTLNFYLELWQDASTVVDFTSQYSATSWSADQALGPPDTLAYGDSRNAWAPRSANGTTEALTVGFDVPVQSTGVVIRETFGNGFVRSVHVRNADTGSFELVATPIDDSAPGTPVDFVVSWPLTDYSVDAVRITIDTNHSLSFEEIDSVHLRGIIPPDTVGPKVIASTPDGGHSGPLSEVELTFDEPIAEGTFTIEDVSDFQGPDGTIAIDAVERLTDRDYRITFQPQSKFGTYSISIGPDILDTSGNPMDQNGNGLSGEPTSDQFDLSFDLELWQDASFVVDFSSQYSPTSWSAEQALGPPDSLTYGDHRTAWAPGSANGTEEFITLGFETPVLATGAVIRETYGNGFVRKVEARESETGSYFVVSTATDDSQPGQPVDFSVSWPRTEVSVDAIRITVDTSHSFGFEEIDAVQLRGIIAPDTTGPSVSATSPESTHSGTVDHVQLTFDETIDVTSFTVDDVVRLEGPNGPIAVTSIQPVNGDTIQIRFDPQTALGRYSYEVGPGITDLSGNPMAESYESGFDLEFWQYASSVIGFSSQYSPFGWSASDALGEPDTANYGDARTAWAPRYANRAEEWLSVGFDTPVFASGVVIRETFGNGFVRQIEVRDAATGIYYAMPFEGDNSLPGTPVDFEVAWPLTSYPVDAVRITIDSAHATTYEEIDSVRLRGVAQ